MPANLTQQYLRAEQAFRAARSDEEALRCLQTMLRELPKHKGTDKLQASLKQKISRLRKSLDESKLGKRAATGRIPRQGAARVVLIGPANSGKSSLLSALTRAKPEVAPYPFTTRLASPGMMPFEDIAIQLIDTPALTADALDADTLSLVRDADLALLIGDMGSDDGIEQLHETLAALNATKSRLAERRYVSADQVGVTYTAALLVLNKMDDSDAATRVELLREHGELALPEFHVSATTTRGFEPLKAAIFAAVDVVRIYTKAPNRDEVDYDKPFTLKHGSTLLDVAELIHADLAKRFRYARVWGSEVEDGGVQQGDYVVRDKDVVEIHT